MSAARVTISLPGELMAKAKARQVDEGFVTFSDWVQELVRRDVCRRKLALAAPKQSEEAAV